MTFIPWGCVGEDASPTFFELTTRFMEARVVKKVMVWLGQRGASSIEYTIIAAVISMAVVVAASSIGQRVGQIYNIVGNSVPK